MLSWLAGWGERPGAAILMPTRRSPDRSGRPKRRPAGRREAERTGGSRPALEGREKRMPAVESFDRRHQAVTQLGWVRLCPISAISRRSRQPLRCAIASRASTARRAASTFATVAAS